MQRITGWSRGRGTSSYVSLSCKAVYSVCMACNQFGSVRALVYEVGTGDRDKVLWIVVWLDQDLERVVIGCWLVIEGVGWVG